VNESIHNVCLTGSESQHVEEILVVVSFSFVNDDLRINFRNQFPNSHWILINTTEVEAQRRIQQRSNHFYMGKPHAQLGNEIPESKQRTSQNVTAVTDPDNNDWVFAPVTFSHTIVNGQNPIEVTSSEIIESILAMSKASSTCNV
jgi:gluconate kinase